LLKLSFSGKKSMPLRSTAFGDESAHFQGQRAIDLWTNTVSVVLGDRVDEGHTAVPVCVGQAAAVVFFGTITVLKAV
jgi:hypothetical protein